MGLFGGSQNDGPGINPNEPKKKPFFRFWEVMWRNSGKIFGLNLIYMVMHAPLFLAGIVLFETNNTLTAMVCLLLLLLQFFLEGAIMMGCARVLKNIVSDKAFFLGVEFKKGFKYNYGASFLIWLLDFFIIVSVVAGYFIYPYLAESLGTKVVYIPYIISLAVALIVLFMNYYLIPLAATTTLRKRDIFVNSFKLALLSPKQCLITTGGTAFMIGICVLLIRINIEFSLLFAFFPAAFIGYLVMFVHYPVIRKYVIDPYYEERGEENPEDDEPTADEEEQRVFTDQGKTEKKKTPKQKGKKGKVIS